MTEARRFPGRRARFLTFGTLFAGAFVAGGEILAQDIGRASAEKRLAADVRELNELQKRVDSAIVTGDTATYVTLITPDAVLMPPDAPAVVGRDAIRDWSRRFAQAFIFESYQPKDDELVVAGDWAFRRAAFRIALTPVAGGQAVRDTGKFVILYRREPDGWKVARDIWNSDGASN